MLFRKFHALLLCDLERVRPYLLCQIVRVQDVPQFPVLVIFQMVSRKTPVTPISQYPPVQEIELRVQVCLVPRYRRSVQDHPIRAFLRDPAYVLCPICAAVLHKQALVYDEKAPPPLAGGYQV